MEIETLTHRQRLEKVISGVLCGGLSRIESMVLGTPENVIREARQAFADTGGKNFILGTGCVVPVTAPFGNLLAARRSVDEPGLV